MKGWSPRSLRVRLLALVLLAIVPAMVLTFFTGLEQRQMARQRAEEDALRLARLASASQERFVEGARQLLIVLAHLPEIQANDPVRSDPLLAELLRQYSLYANFGVATAAGTITCSALPIAQPVPVADRAWFQQAVRTRRFTVGDYQIGRITHKPTINFSYPLLNATGAVQAVVFAALDLEWLQKLAASARLPEGATLTVVDRHGTILSHYPHPAPWIGRTLPDAPLVRAILAQRGQGTCQTSGFDLQQRLYAFAPLRAFEGGSTTCVAVGIPLSLAYGEATHVLRQSLGLLAVVAILALLAAWVAQEFFILRDARSLVRATQRLHDGDFSARTGVAHDRSEFGQLAAAFDEMANSLEQRLAERERAAAALRALNTDLERRVTERTDQLQRTATQLARSNAELEQFASVASHDLQEPLRMVASFTQLLAERYRGKLDAEADEFIGYTVGGARRMKTLIDDLLRYSRVTTGGQPFQPTDSSRALECALQNLKVASDESAAVVTHDPLPTCLADASQLTELFQNLVANAIKYRGAEPPRIHISARRTGPDWEFTVRDNGIGIDPNHFGQIFVIFQRLHTDKQYPGTGIGLAVCKKIVERHGGRIWVESQPGQGSRFHFTVPAH